jgi:hypothetical protein
MKGRSLASERVAQCKTQRGKSLRQQNRKRKLKMTRPPVLPVYRTPTPRSELVRMRGPVGADEVNASGEHRFPISDDGFFHVPRHVANALLASGVSGFTEMAPLSQGEILMVAINSIGKLRQGVIRDALQAATGVAALALARVADPDAA